MVGGGAERGGTGMGMTGPIRVGEAHSSLWSGGGEGIGDGGWGRCSAAAAAWRLLGAAMRCFMHCPKGLRRRATPAPPSSRDPSD